MVIFGPRGSKLLRGGEIDGGASKTETRGCRERGGRKLADESRSGSTWGKVVVRGQPSVTAAIVRLFLSSPPFYFLFTPFLFLLALFVPPPRLNPSDYPPSSSLFVSPAKTPPFPRRWTFIFGEIRDIDRGRWLPLRPLRRSSWPETSCRSLEKTMVSSTFWRISSSRTFLFIRWAGNSTRFKRIVIKCRVSFGSN